MTTELMNALSLGFSNTETFMLQSLNVVLPIALFIFGIMIVWIFASKFFKKLSGNKVKDNNKDDDDDLYDDED